MRKISAVVSALNWIIDFIYQPRAPYVSAYMTNYFRQLFRRREVIEEGIDRLKNLAFLSIKAGPFWSLDDDRTYTFMPSWRLQRDELNSGLLAHERWGLLAYDEPIAY